jgi:hypothetical protein
MKEQRGRVHETRRGERGKWLEREMDREEAEMWEGE